MGQESANDLSTEHNMNISEVGMNEQTNQLDDSIPANDDDIPVEEPQAGIVDQPTTSRLQPQLRHRPTSRYGCKQRLTTRMKEAIELSAFVSTLALTEELEPITETLHPLIYLSTVNKDTMYFHEALKQPDAPQFVDTIIKEINNHVNRKYWELVP